MVNHELPLSTRTRVPRVLRLSCLVIFALSGPATRAAEPASPSMLHLANGGYAAGEIRDSAQPGMLRWQAGSFVSPFDFGVSEVNAIQWPAPAELSKPAGDFCFELAGGD